MGERGHRPERVAADPMTESVAVAPSGTFCGAKTREGAKYPACRRPAGWGTDHVGEGRCKLHGGRSLVRHGRYSKVKRTAVRRLIEQYEADPDPLNLLPEVAALRALFTDYIERYDVMREALLGWYASFEVRQRRLPYDQELAFGRVIDEYEAVLREGEPTSRQEEDLKLARKFVEKLAEPVAEAKPRTILDLADAGRLLDMVGKMVERIEKIRAENAISRPDLIRVMGEMARVLQLHVTDRETLEKIVAGWEAIRV